MMRVIVTGSRDWSDKETIWRQMWSVHCNALAEGIDGITLVHGACPTGADAIAVGYAEYLSWSIEPHEADWVTHGRRAGPIRNQHMVDLDADLCLAFIGPCTRPHCRVEGTHSSHGADGCARMAEEAEIETRRITP